MAAQKLSTYESLGLYIEGRKNMRGTGVEKGEKMGEKDKHLHLALGGLERQLSVSVCSVSMTP